MPLYINSNINSLVAQRNLSRSQDSLSTSLERLSSGLRINSAKDDAAGLAIATRFTTQVNGLDQAVRNANDGVSLSQTSESALSEVTNNLQRIRQLAVESANSTNSDSDRAAIDQEVQQRISEVSRIANQTTFNGLKVLDGSFGEATFQVGANVGDTIGVNLSTGVGASQIGDIASSGGVDLSSNFAATGASVESTDLSSNLSFGTTPATKASFTSDAITGADYSTTPKTITINDTNGHSASVTLNQDYSTDVAGELSAIKAGLDDVNFDVTIDSTNNKITIDSAVAGGNSITVDSAGQSVLGTGSSTPGTDAVDNSASFDVDGTTVTLDQDYANVDALVTDVGGQLGSAYNASNDGGKLKVETTATGSSATLSISNVDPALSFGAVTPGADAASLTLASGDLSVQVGDGDVANITGTFENVDDLSNAINSAGLESLHASVDENDQLHLTAADELKVTGSQASSLGFNASYTVSGSLDGVDVTTVDDSNDAIQRVDSALTSVSSLRSKLGAIQNRFQSTIANLTSVSQNLSSARSRIQDADFAKETASLTRAQILQNAGISVLSQANASPQRVLQLLQ